MQPPSPDGYHFPRGRHSASGQRPALMVQSVQSTGDGASGVGDGVGEWGLWHWGAEPVASGTGPPAWGSGGQRATAGRRSWRTVPMPTALSVGSNLPPRAVPNAPAPHPANCGPPLSYPTPCRRAWRLEEAVEEATAQHPLSSDVLR